MGNDFRQVKRFILKRVHLKWEVIVDFVDIGGIDDHRCLNFLFILINDCNKNYLCLLFCIHPIGLNYARYVFTVPLTCVLQTGHLRMAGAQSTQQTTSPHGKNAIVESTSRHILHSLCCRSCLFSSINDSISSIIIKNKKYISYKYII